MSHDAARYVHNLIRRATALRAQALQHKYRDVQVDCSTWPVQAQQAGCSCLQMLLGESRQDSMQACMLQDPLTTAYKLGSPLEIYAHPNVYNANHTKVNWHHAVQKMLVRSHNTDSELHRGTTEPQKRNSRSNIDSTCYESAEAFTVQPVASSCMSHACAAHPRCGSCRPCAQKQDREFYGPFCGVV